MYNEIDFHEDFTVSRNLNTVAKPFVFYSVLTAILDLWALRTGVASLLKCGVLKVKIKIGPYWPQLIWHFGTQLAKNRQSKWLICQST